MHCPTCGSEMIQEGEATSDVATYHERLDCINCGAQWEATWQKGYHDELMSLTPMNSCFVTSGE